VTRLFEMLGQNEKTFNSVKRDHASYAKLNLLTQQAQLLQQQAVNVVNKAASKPKPADDDIKLTCTTLSTEFDDSAGRLLQMMNVNESTVLTIKKDAPSSARLSLLGEQVELLQQQAQEAVDDAKLNSYLGELTEGKVAKLVTGTMYYLYTQNGKEVLSRIASHEWSNYDQYHGKYFYDYDFTFRRHLEEHEKQVREEKVLLLSHTLAAGKGNSWGGLHVAATPSTPAATKDAEEDAMAMDLSEPTDMPASVTDRPAKAAVDRPICSVFSRW